MITEFLKPAGVTGHLCDPTGAPSPQLEDSPASGLSLVMDLSESLLASQSDLGPYWGIRVSPKRDRPVLVDQCLDEESSKGELEESLVLATAVQTDDSCDSEDIGSGFLRYRESNLMTWLGLRLPWAVWRPEAIPTLRAYRLTCTHEYRVVQSGALSGGARRGQIRIDGGSS